MSSSIKENIESIQCKIGQLSKKFNLNSEKINLVAVSKFQSIEKIEEAYQCGLRDFGENYIQEWQEKSRKLSHLKDIRWHIIGSLQKNKVKYLNQNVHCLQSVDSISLLQELEKKWSYEKPLNILIQLKIDPNDSNKSGVSVEKAYELCEKAANMNCVNHTGFMGIGPLLNDTSKIKPLYINFVNKCNDLWHLFPNKLSSSMYISLGMSQDLEIALECGSNMLRIGTSLFGKR